MASSEPLENVSVLVHILGQRSSLAHLSPLPSGGPSPQQPGTPSQVLQFPSQARWPAMPARKVADGLEGGIESCSVGRRPTGTHEYSVGGNGLVSATYRRGFAGNYLRGQRGKCTFSWYSTLSKQGTRLCALKQYHCSKLNSSAP